MAPGTIYRRAVKRVERRAENLRAVRPMAYSGPIVIGTGAPIWSHCAECERANLLLREAVTLANRLAYCAGIAGPLASRPTR